MLTPLLPVRVVALLALGNPTALGHCGGALAQHEAATVELIPGAPHTLLNLPAARHATQGFLREVLRP